MFDLAVIGAGPGGFEAALRARELGFTVALIEKSEPGGTCLNTGCIPTKALLASTKLLSKIKNAESYGLSPVTPTWDVLSLVQRKNRIVERLKKGMLDPLKRSGVEWIQGEARFTGKNRLSVTGEGKREIDARFILIATGSEPTSFPGTPFDGKSILSSTDLLEPKSVPERLLILGGGVIGVEFASIFQPLGTKVILVEMMERLIPLEDEEVSGRLESLFGRKGIEVYVGEKVRTLAPKADTVEASLESGRKIETDQVLVALGRKPRLQELGLEKAGVKTENGFILVNEYLETSAAGIFAIGDVTTRSTGLAHGASAEGVRVVENLKGPRKKMDHSVTPHCIYTDPEVASVGTIHGLLPQEIVQTKILFSAIGKSHIESEVEGFVKMFASKEEGRILGFTGIGGHVTELVHEAALAIKAHLSVRELADLVHAHPTESEILHEAARKLAALLKH